MTAAQSSRTAVWTSYAAFLGLGLQAGLLGLAWESIRTDLGLPLEAVGVLLFAGTAGYLTSSFVSGTLAHRLGYTRLYIGAAIIYVLGMAGYATAPSLPLLALAAVVAGAGSGTIDGGLNAYSAAHFSGREVNWMHAAFGLGTTLSPLMLTALLASGGWRIGYVVVAAYLALVLLLFVVTRSVWGWPPEHAPEPGGRTHGARDAIRSPLVWLSILIFFVYAGVEVSPGQWTFSLFTSSRGFDPTVAGFWVSFYWGSFTVGRILFGLVSDRWAVPVVLRWSMVGLMAGALLYWLNPFQGVGGIIGLGVMGFAQAPMFPYLVLNTPRVVGKARASHSIGFQVAGAGLGVAVLPSLAGVLAAQIDVSIIAPFIFVGTVALLLLYEALNALSSGRSQASTAPLAE